MNKNIFWNTVAKELWFLEILCVIQIIKLVIRTQHQNAKESQRITGNRIKAKNVIPWMK